MCSTERDRRHAEAFRDLEGAICEVRNMALLTLAFVDGPQGVVNRLDKAEGAALSFAMNQIDAKAAALHRAYYAEFSGEA
jgi:hypothetical protein